MTIRPKLLDNELFFSSAASVLNPGYYQKYVNDYPSFLQQDDSRREPSGNTCKMIVATTWQNGRIGNVIPRGRTYFVFTYQDHIHTGGDPHFNNMVQVYTHNAGGQPIRFTMERGIDNHYIRVAATGTSLAYLEQAFRIPANDNGPLSDLLRGGTSIDPYPPG